MAEEDSMAHTNGVAAVREGAGEKVLVTGGSGFIGSHVVRCLLEDTDYQVRTTVRDLSAEDKVEPLKALAPDHQGRLEILQADLTTYDPWESAISGCDYVIHVASPFPEVLDGPRSEDEVVKPAVEGTTNVLKACQAASRQGKPVRRVVLTSSAVAVHDMSNGTVSGKTLSEEDWADVEKAGNGYAKSKIHAEKAAWEFVEKLEGDDKFELAVINPTLVVGPVLIKSMSTSMQFVKRLMERQMPAVPKLSFPCIDVRDVAWAHIKALTLPGAAGKRHILSAQTLWLKEMASILHKEFKAQGYNVPTVSCPYVLLWVTSCFDKSVKQLLPVVGKETLFDNTRMREVLGIEPVAMKTSIIDMAYSMIEHGQVRRSKKYKGPGHNKGEDEKENEGDKKEEGEEKGVEGGEQKGVEGGEEKGVEGGEEKVGGEEKKVGGEEKKVGGEEKKVGGEEKKEEVEEKDKKKEDSEDNKVVENGDKDVEEVAKESSKDDGSQSPPASTEAAAVNGDAEN